MIENLVLEEILGCREISGFSREWINHSHNDKEKIKQIYNLLREIGLSDEKIASQVQLLGFDPSTILGNYRALSNLGIKDEKIASRAELLGINPKTIERNYNLLSRLGIKNEKIVSQANLLGFDPATIKKNYQHHIGLLRQNIEDRTSGRELLTNQAQLLGISRETISANVQYLHSLGIYYNNGFLLGTTTQLKRKKMAWLLREVFDYRTSENKKETIHRMYEFVRDNPKYLITSISNLEKEKYKIREKYTQTILKNNKLLN